MPCEGWGGSWHDSQMEAISHHPKPINVKNGSRLGTPGIMVRGLGFGGFKVQGAEIIRSP